MSILGRLPLPAATGVVAALGVAGLLSGRFFNWGILSLVTLALPLAVALLYLREYSRKELRRPSPAPRNPPTPAPESPVVLLPPTMETSEPPVHPDEVTLTLFDDSVPDPARDSGTVSTEKSAPGTDQPEVEGRTNNSG